MHGARMASPPVSCRLPVLAVIAALVLPAHVSAAASCVSPPAGADQSLYSACLGLASQLATMSLPSNGASVVLTTKVELPVSTSTIYDPFGFPTAVVPVTETSQTSAASMMSSTTTSSESASGAGSSGTQSGAVTSGPSSATQGGAASSTLSTATQTNTGSSSQPSGLSQTGTSSTASNGAAIATSSPGVTQSSVDGANNNYRDTVVIPVALVCTVVPVLLIAVFLWFCCRRRQRRKARTLAVASSYGGEDQSGPVAGQDRIDSGLAVNGMAEVKGAGRDPCMRNPATTTESSALERGAAVPSSGDATNTSMYSPAADTAAPTAYHSAKPSLGGTRPSSGMQSAAVPAAAGAAVAAAGATSAAGRPKSRSSSQSRPGSASRFAGWLPGRPRADSRAASRQGTAHSASNASGRASIASERPPTLPDMPVEMGSGKWFDSQDSGREHNEPAQAVSLKAGSSIYDEREESAASALSKPPPFVGDPQSSLQSSSVEASGVSRPSNSASGFLNPFRTPPTGTSMSSDLGPRQESRSTHRSSDAIPVGGSASTEAAAAARSAEDDSLVGPYRPPTPYDELSMMTSARVRGNTSSSYTSPSAVGNIVQGPFNAGPGGNYSRPVPPQIQTPTTATGDSRGTNGASSGATSEALERLGPRTTSSRHASPPPSSAQQVMYYPSQEEARTFDFGEGPGSPISESRELFYDATEDR